MNEASASYKLAEADHTNAIRRTPVTTRTEEQTYHQTRAQAAQTMRENLIAISLAAPQKRTDGNYTRRITFKEGDLNLITNLLYEVEGLHRDILEGNIYFM